MSEKMIVDLTAMAAELRQSDVRVVVLLARGKSFCAGGDLKWMQAQIMADASSRAMAVRALEMMLYAWNTLPQAVIDCIHCNAFGGGFGIDL